MKILSKLFIFSAFIFCANQAQADNSGPTPEGNSDTSVSIKSNIVIFKMISGQQNATNSVSGTLKKAGKVARTSNSATTTLKTPIILPPKRNF